MINCNLPTGCTVKDIDSAAGFSGDEEYDDYCNECYDNMRQAHEYEYWLHLGKPEAEDAQDEDFDAYCYECDLRKLDPGTYREWMNGHNAMIDEMFERGDFEYQQKKEAVFNARGNV